MKNFYSLPLYILMHPFDGFYAMKYEKKGTVRLAIFNFFMLCISTSFKNQYASVIVNQSYRMNLNSLLDFGSLLLVLILFCASNWSVTSLTNGEGKFKDIFMAICYAMTPMVLTYIPATILSNFLAEGEAAFFHLLIGVSTAWFVLLVYIGLVTVHNYTATKALTTVLLTFVALLIIVFLLTLLLTLLQQMYTFGVSIYTELMFRT